MSSATPHRIDSRSFAVPHIEGSRRPVVSGSAPSSPSADDSASQVDKKSPPEAASGSKQPVVQQPVIQRIDCSHPIDDPLESPGFAAERPDCDDWLQLHAADLIDRLQSWATELDAREAQLNARSAVQDHRERQSRMEQHDIAAELAEQQRSIERLQAEIQTRARQLAFVDTPNGL